MYIRIDRIIEVFKQLSESKVNIGNESELAQVKKDTSEEKLMRDLTNFLINKRVKFIDLFKSSSDAISHSSLKSAFALINFPYNPEDLNKLLLSMDPTNRGSISIISIKNMIINFRTDYFEMPFNKIDTDSMRKQNSQTSRMISQPQLKSIIDKINEYILKNKLLINEFFSKVNRKNPNFLNEKELIELIKSTISSTEEKVRDYIKLGHKGLV